MKKALSLFALIVVTCIGSTGALAATKHVAKSHTFNATVQQTILTSTGSPPLSGTAVYVGTVSGSYGNGAQTANTTFTGGGAFTATGTIFAAAGTASGTQSGKGTLNPDGSISITGTGKIVHGTGQFKGSKGTFTFTGTQAKGSSVVTLKLKGTVKY